MALTHEGLTSQEAARRRAETGPNVIFTPSRVTIFAIILLLTMAEVQNEFRAKRAVQYLAEVASHQATVMRDGELMHIEAAYVFAGTRGLTSAQQGSLAFAAWMIGHVALAFVSRSDREPLASVGPFSNRVADAWALSTAVLLLVGMYVQGIASRIDLTPVPIGLLLLIAVVVVVWMLLLVVRKYVRSARKSPEAVAA